jgi:hypothetical protein
MPLPSFVIIGAAKAGTSALYKMLAQHPQIFMSPVKETGFFSMMDENPSFSTIPAGAGVNRIEESQKRFLETRRRSVTAWDDYELLFSGSENYSAIGEISPFYLYNPRTAGRIARYLPDVRIIVILRNPADRAFSHFLHYRRDGLEPHESMDDAIDDEDITIDDVWWGYRHYVRVGLYHSQLSRYLEHFPVEQLKIILYDDLNTSFTASLSDIFRFVGVDPSFLPETSVTYNVSGIPRSRFLHNLLSRPNSIRNAAKRVLPENVYQKLTRNPLLSKLRSRNLARPQLESNTRGRLDDIFRNDIVNTGALIGRDLEFWLD